MPSPSASSSSRPSRRGSRLAKRTLAAAAVVALSQAGGVHAQTMDDLVGTWSSGSGAVETGNGFINPLNYTFFYPKTTGISYSFTADGHFEEALYRFKSNATMPQCIQALIYWQHGTYDLLSNGSIILTPLGSDGRIQVQDPCAASSNILTVYNETEYMPQFTTGMDNVKNVEYLQLYQYDGSPLAPMYLKYRQPNMLPVEQLVQTGETTKTRMKRDGTVVENAALPSAPGARWTVAGLGAAVLAAVATVL